MQGEKLASAKLKEERLKHILQRGMSNIRELRDAVHAEGCKWRNQYEHIISGYQQRVQHHIHPRSDQDKTVRVIPTYCQRVDNPGVCKARYGRYAEIGPGLIACKASCKK